jgi:thioredoxin-related protein
MRSALFAMLLAISAFGAALGAEGRDPMEHFFQPFLGDLREELADAKARGREAVMVMYHFEECPACARMKRNVLSQPRVQEAFRRDFQVLAIDTLGDQPITGIDGKTMPEKEFARTVSVKVTPTFDFFSPDGKLAYRHQGGLFEVEDFLLLGRYVASGAYQKQTFADFRRTAARKGS